MKIIQIKNGVVVDIINARNDVSIESLAVVEEIPQYDPKDGFSGILMYGESGLYWEYVVNPPEDEQEISSEEFQQMIEEVL